MNRTKMLPRTGVLNVVVLVTSRRNQRADKAFVELHERAIRVESKFEKGGVVVALVPLE